MTSCVARLCTAFIQVEGTDEGERSALLAMVDVFDERRDDVGLNRAARRSEPERRVRRRRAERLGVAEGAVEPDRRATGQRPEANRTILGVDGLAQLERELAREAQWHTFGARGLS